jgi:methionine-rich copper-binding protein CopC
LPKAKLLIMLAAAAALASLALSGIAEAHSRPVRFDPAPGSVLTTAPSNITGWFTSDIRSAEESFIQVLDADGANVATGDIQLSTDRRQMSVALQSGVGDGRYVVYWSTFDDADGEVFSGCYAFFVGQAAADDAVANGQALDAAADCPSMGEADDGEMADNAASLQIDVSVSGSSATVTMSPTNFTARPPDGSTVDPNFGHYHIYLDKVPDDVLTGTHSHDEMDMGDTSSDSTPMADDSSSDSGDSMNMDDSSGLAENPVMWVENSHTFDDLAPGVHTISVALFHDDHTPLSPPVIASQSFTIGGSSSDGGGIPAWALILAIAGGLVVGGIGMKLAGGRA